MEVVEAIEVYSRSSARYRYRVPVALLRELRYDSSHYSAQFDVAGRLWRFHLQERRGDADNNNNNKQQHSHRNNNNDDEDDEEAAAESGGRHTRYLALHLQSCTAGSVFAHFKLSVVCMQNPLLSVSKTFRCAFKKAGSAWGLHHFMPMRELLDVDKGYVYTVDGTGTRCVDVEVTLQILPHEQPPSSPSQPQRDVAAASRSPRQRGLVARSRSSSRSRSRRHGKDAAASHAATSRGQHQHDNNNNYSYSTTDKATTRAATSSRSASAQQAHYAPPQAHEDSRRRRSHAATTRSGVSPQPHRHLRGSRGSSRSSSNNSRHRRRQAAAAAAAAPLSPPHDALRRNGHHSHGDLVAPSRSRSAQGASSRRRSHPYRRNDNEEEEDGDDVYAYRHASSAQTRHGVVTTSTHGGSSSTGAAAVTERSPAALVYPFGTLEALCDMSFDVSGERVKAHRCVIGARMRALLPEAMLPLQPGCIVAIAVPLDVFATFLRYVYTEACPDAQTLSAEALLDLYLLCAACEFYDVCAVCVRDVQPLLTRENILPIVLTRYNAADEVLTALYVRVLLQHYDVLIQDKQFEQMPGHLFRRLSLILHRKEAAPSASLPAMKHTLASQLAWLADTGTYSDYDWLVAPQGYAVRTHRYILACRCSAFAHAFAPHNNSSKNGSSNNTSVTSLPDFTTSEYDFSLRSWQKMLMALYRHQLPRITATATTSSSSSLHARARVQYDVGAEDVAMIYKMHQVLGMDGQLRREADDAVGTSNALRLLIYAAKHHLPELHERGIAYVAGDFARLVRDDAQAWPLIAELPQPAVVSLFRTVVEHLT